MEESFSDMGDWKAIINLSEEELADVEDEVLFQKMETFKQDLEADLSGHELRDKVFVTEHLVRRLLPFIVKTKDNLDGKVVKFLGLILCSIRKLLIHVKNYLENGQDDFGDSDLNTEFNKANLQIGMVLIDLTRDTIECNFADDSFTMTLIDMVPGIIQTAAEHCQNSVQIYGDAMNSLADDLKMLFMKCKAAITSFIGIVDSGQDQFAWTGLSKFMTELDLLQPVLLDLEFHTFGVVCKTYIRICKTHWSELWQSRYDATPHLTFVCKRTEKSVRDLKMHLARSDESGLKRESNILAFLLKTIRQQTKLIEDSLAEKSDFYQTLFSLACSLSTLDDVSSTSPSMFIDIPPKLTTEIPTLIFNFGHQLASQPEFAEFFLNRQNQTGPESIRGVSIFLAKILSWMWSSKDGDLAKIWFLEDGKHLFQALVTSLSSSHTDLCAGPHLPGVQYSGKPLTSFSTYEFILSRTQAFVAGLRPELLEHVEMTLLKTLLEESSFWSAQFCIDVWAFLARYGPRELCLAHIRLLLEIVKSKKFCDDRKRFIQSAIKRLFAFLCPEDMLTIKNCYSLSVDQNDLHIWKLISGTSLLKSKVHLNDLQFVSVSFLEQFLSGNFTPDLYNLCCASIHLLTEHWTILDKERKIFVSTLLSGLWSKIEQYNEIENWDKSWIVRMLDPLFRLTEKIVAAGQKDAGFVLRSVVSVPGKTSYLIDKTSCLLAKCSGQLSAEEMSFLTQKINGNSHTSFALTTLKRLSVLQEKHQNPSESFDDYFWSLNFHSKLICHRKSLAASSNAKPVSRRDIKKRKLIHNYDDDRVEANQNSMKVSLESIRSEIQSRNISPASRIAYLAAVSTLENFLNSKA